MKTIRSLNRTNINTLDNLEETQEDSNCSLIDHEHNLIVFDTFSNSQIKVLDSSKVYLTESSTSINSFSTADSVKLKKFPIKLNNKVPIIFIYLIIVFKNILLNVIQ